MVELNILPIIFATVLVAAVVHGISGFAFGIIMLMVLPYFFSYSQALAMVSFMTVFVLGYNAFLYRQHINWKQVPLAVGAFVVIDFFAVWLLKYVGDAPIWHTLLGIFFILMAAYLLWGQNRFKIKPTTANALLFNGASGLITGLFGAGGPIAAVYFLAVAKDTKEYLGTTQIIFFFTIAIDVVLRAINGMYTSTMIVYGVSSLWCVVIGLLIGKKLFQYISAATLRKIVCALMVFSGIKMLLG